jgi:hypothetical protein
VRAHGPGVAAHVCRDALREHWPVRAPVGSAKPNGGSSRCAILPVHLDAGGILSPAKVTPAVRGISPGSHIAATASGAPDYGPNPDPRSGLPRRADAAPAVRRASLTSVDEPSMHRGCLPHPEHVMEPRPGSAAAVATANPVKLTGRPRGVLLAGSRTPQPAGTGQEHRPGRSPLTSCRPRPTRRTPVHRVLAHHGRASEQNITIHGPMRTDLEWGASTSLKVRFGCEGALHPNRAPLRSESMSLPDLISVARGVRLMAQDPAALET